MAAVSVKRSIVSGIVTDDAPVSYWPVLFIVPRPSGTQKSRINVAVVAMVAFLNYFDVSMVMFPCKRSHNVMIIPRLLRWKD